MEELERYDWYECDFTAFLLSLHLPAYRRDMPIKEAIEKEKDSFETGFTEMIRKKLFRRFSDHFYDSLASKLPEIKKIFDLLVSIIDAYDNADMATAQERFNLMMEQVKPYFILSDISWPQYTDRFFRVRGSTDKLKDPKDLFHIPYKKRHLISNERYSLAGHPCLYLASYLHIAWQECGYPHKYYYSEFKYQFAEKEDDEWKFITLLSPRDVANRWFVAINPPEESYLNIAVSYLFTYPLIFACSIVNLNGSSAFKPEFVIPQMLTQWVYRNYDFVKGVKYFSCYDADDIRHYYGFNVVMPAKNIDYRRGLSKDLMSKFKVSKPVFLENKLGENEATTVKKFKEDLVATMRSSFREATDCLNAFYNVTDLLDKALRHSDDSDMRLIISAVRNVTQSGQKLIGIYSKESIIQQFRVSLEYTQRAETRIESFVKIYDRFQKEVLDIADTFNTLVDRIARHTIDEFFDV